MRIAHYTDDRGRRMAVRLPDDVPDSRAPAGIAIGPPSLAPLGLPRETEVRLHNALHDRGILTEQDAVRRISDVVAAVMSAFRVDAQRIQEVYVAASREAEQSAERFAAQVATKPEIVDAEPERAPEVPEPPPVAQARGARSR